MIFNRATLEQKEAYEKLLKIVGSLSNLFSDSSIPYLYYRVAENAFCRAFQASNLSRSDCSVDAAKDFVGFGLKTFLYGNGKTYQKVAEFNSDRALYKDLPPRELLEKIASLRNERVLSTKRIHNLKDVFYHCILRDSNKFLVYEEPMELVDIQNIKAIKAKDSSIYFEDGKHEYSFLLSKSTLTKRFTTKKTIYEFDVSILDDPFTLLEKAFLDFNTLTKSNFEYVKDTVYLPLYSEKRDFSASGLNQWNAEGRKRDPDEVYISIPAFVRQNSPSFFPKRNVPFTLNLPNGEKLTAKVCQDGGKALMSNPNKALGKWILRDVLNLKQGELVTKERLNILGIDSVRIDKINDFEFDINFSQIGSYQEFSMNKSS